jgi:2-polyprenyl-6-methoxyphenol hydroxylase-like FAD-dependent oxidoreductase
LPTANSSDTNISARPWHAPETSPALASAPVGATQLPNFLRRSGGPGWALVGDAGCHKDPYLALGIGDAFRDAELLADALDAALSDPGRATDTLGEYQRRGNEATVQDYRRNLQEARLNPPPADVLETRACLRGNQAAINHYMLEGEGLLATGPSEPSD